MPVSSGPFDIKAPAWWFFAGYAPPLVLLGLLTVAISPDLPWMGLWFAVLLLGLVCLAVADALVGVRFDVDALVLENRWVRATVPWGVVGDVVDVADGAAVNQWGRPKTRRIRLSVGTPAGPITVDVASLGYRTRDRFYGLADMLREVVETRRIAGYGEVVLERPWPRVVLRTAGVVLTVAPFAVMFVAGFAKR